MIIDEINDEIKKLEKNTNPSIKELILLRNLLELRYCILQSERQQEEMKNA
jgi:hypothetical protein